MTTLNQLRVESIDGPVLTLRAECVYGQARLLPTSRTFAIGLLWETLERYNWTDEHFPSPADWMTYFADVMASPLALFRGGNDWLDEEWNLDAARRLISCVGMTDRQHFDPVEDPDDPEWDDGGVENPRATYRVVVNDPVWIAHLQPGLEWRSTAYDYDPAAPVDPSWLTAAVVGLVGAIGEDVPHERLPILADALAEAGCTDADILAHCRSAGPHAPGCWAVDRLARAIAANR